MCDQVTGNSQTANDKEQRLIDYVQAISSDQPTKHSKRLKSGLVKRDPIVQLRYAKYLLVLGMGVNEVALRTRLPLKAVQKLAVSYNPKFRKISNRRQVDMENITLEMFRRGDDLRTICKFLDLPLYTIIMYLAKQGITEKAIALRMPPADDPLVLEYHKTVTRKKRSKYKALSLH
ncbi:hypothetical protein [Enterobacter hormaechei]|uniref:hypothetical protein n=1 Tax=Enterobacter hormaechei TaxID=158836 RepID=UPI000F824D30|nr:hypothetical protein [Enterobacter hormaechei]MCV2339010.1 hypothetical protein [Enterobacter hormaechei]RTN64923.1 hypothetical protein EKN80_21835 [Enterobacter hormaechei]RTQ00216.1 hypothetical protein EKN23_23135 [Enterobacter hormaechei]